MSYIYLYCDPKTGIERYVGFGKKSRAWSHLRGSHNRRLDNMLKKRIREGFDPQPIILLDGLSELSAKAIEIFWIATIGRDDKQKGSLFNATDGGDGQSGVIKGGWTSWKKGLKVGPNAKLRGQKLSPDHVEKRTQSRRDKYNGNYRSEMSDEARAALSEKTRLSWIARREKYGANGRRKHDV